MFKYGLSSIFLLWFLIPSAKADFAMFWDRISRKFTRSRYMFFRQGADEFSLPFSWKRDLIYIDILLFVIKELRCRVIR